ncbi:aspartate-rich protein 1 isoform X4 [Homo sapiens]|nr:aspartate-rich protein 1 isoform X4 [Homo sapiens]
MPTGPPEDRLSLKFLPSSEEDNDDAKILPSPVQGSSEDNLSLVCLPRSEDDDCDDDDDDAQILPSRVQGGCYRFDSSSCSSEDNLSLVCLPRSEDDDCDDDDDDAQILPSPVQACSEDSLFLRCSLRHKDEEEEDDDDIHITARIESDLTLESLSDEEIHPASHNHGWQMPRGCVRWPSSRMKLNFREAGESLTALDKPSDGTAPRDTPGGVDRDMEDLRQRVASNVTADQPLGKYQRGSDSWARCSRTALSKRFSIQTSSKK